jgi:hypothetical protein
VTLTPGIDTTAWGPYILRTSIWQGNSSGEFGDDDVQVGLIERRVIVAAIPQDDICFFLGLGQNVPVADAHIGVPRQSLDGHHVGPSFQQVRNERSPQIVRRERGNLRLRHPPPLRSQRAHPLLPDLQANRKTHTERDVQQQSPEPQEVERFSEKELQEDCGQPASADESWMREKVVRPQQNEHHAARHGRYQVQERHLTLRLDASHDSGVARP